MEETIETVESIIRKWDSNTPSFTKIVSMFNLSRTEAKEFIICVHHLRNAMHFLVSHDSQSPKLARAHTLMQIAIARLSSSNRDKLDPESVSGQSSDSSNSWLERIMRCDDDDENDNKMRKASEFTTQTHALNPPLETLKP